MLLTQAHWAQVTPDSPCPLCDKPDWCSASDNGEAILCRRIDPAFAPGDWKHIKDSSDGYPIYALRGSQGKIKSKRRLKKVSLPVPFPIPDDEIKLASLPEPITHPVAQRSSKSWGYDLFLNYPYSPTQYVERTEHYDESGNRIKINKKTKITLPYHQNSEGEWVNAKGQQGWPAYRIDEAIAHDSPRSQQMGIRG